MQKQPFNQREREEGDTAFGGLAPRDGPAPQRRRRLAWVLRWGAVVLVVLLLLIVAQALSGRP